MKDEVLPEGPLEEDAVHFQSERRTPLRAVAIGSVFVLVSLWLLLSDGLFGLFQQTVIVLALVFFGFVTVTHLSHLGKGKALGGLLVDGDGIVDRTTYSPIGRVYWHEIKAIYPVEKTFFPGFSTDLPVIGLDVTDSFLQRKPAKIRRNVWWTRHVFRAPDIQIPSKTLTASREEILRALEGGLRQYELRSIWEAKQLESGKER